MKTPLRSKSSTLNFPNESRSFDEKRARVCFWGYDSAIEISFYVEADTLKTLRPEMESTEIGILQAFDSVREQIHGVASKVHGRSDNGTYAHILGANDF